MRNVSVQNRGKHKLKKVLSRFCTVLRISEWCETESNGIEWNERMSKDIPYSLALGKAIAFKTGRQHDTTTWFTATDASVCIQTIVTNATIRKRMVCLESAESVLKIRFSENERTKREKEDEKKTNVKPQFGCCCLFSRSTIDRVISRSQSKNLLECASLFACVSNLMHRLAHRIDRLIEEFHMKNVWNERMSSTSHNRPFSKLKIIEKRVCQMRWRVDERNRNQIWTEINWMDGKRRKKTSNKHIDFDWMAQHRKWLSGR